jgi:hypothetical protein
VKKYPGGREEKWEYCWMNNVPVKLGEEAIRTNFIELTLTITTKNDKKESVENLKFSYITNIKINRENIADIIETGRARWQIENCQFNVMKNHGYYLEHNFGQGKNNLGEIIVCLCNLDFNYHILSDIIDPLWQKARNLYNTNKAFFEVLKSILPSIKVRSIRELLRRVLYVGTPRGSPI